MIQVDFGDSLCGGVMIRQSTHVRYQEAGTPDLDIAVVFLMCSRTTQSYTE
jgi:hypothetical protein